MKRPLLVLAAVCLLASALPSSATAASGWAGAGAIDTTDTGIADPASGARYFALSEDRGTTLLRVQPDAELGSQAMQRLRLDDQLKMPLKIPAVAMDGTTSGLSADGESLVLADPYVVPGQAVTRMVLVDTDRMRVEKQIRLDGAFVFDAISPDGSRIYLIRYPNPRDPLDYEVRAWDVSRERLLSEPIVDPREPDEEMRGRAITRVVSPDGTWALTLYDGDGKEPFVHALNTVEGTAFCVDLEMLSGSQSYRAELQPSADWSTVAVVQAKRGEQLASISTEDWVATESAELEPEADADGSVAGWWLILAGVVLVALAAITRRLRRRGQQAPDPMPGDPFSGADPDRAGVHEGPQDRPTSSGASPSP